MKAPHFQQIVRAWLDSNVITLVYDFGIAPADGLTVLTRGILPTPRHNTARLRLPSCKHNELNLAQENEDAFCSL